MSFCRKRHAPTKNEKISGATRELLYYTYTIVTRVFVLKNILINIYKNEREKPEFLIILSVFQETQCNIERV